MKATPHVARRAAAIPMTAMRRVLSAIPPIARTGGLALCLGAAGCAYVPNLDDIPLIHRIDIQQGNVVTQDMLAQLEKGMDKKQVRFIMGTPMIQDTFHGDRWDYLYTFREGRRGGERRLVTLVFKEDVLEHVEGDVVAAPGRLEVVTRQDKIVEVPKAKKRGIIAKVKDGVFGDDEVEPNAVTDEILAEEGLDTGDDQDAPAAPGDTPSSAAPDDELSASESADEDADEPTAAKEEKGVFGRFLDRFGLGDKETASDDRDDALIYRDPTDPDYESTSR